MFIFAVLYIDVIYIYTFKKCLERDSP